MTINKFQGKTQEEAIAKAKEEFGERAVIMNIREVKPKGLFRAFKNSTFEVTAAMEEKEHFSNAMQAAQQYDIYYRVHVQSYGWLDWAKNGQMSGTSGLAKRLEGIQIVLVPKGAAAPGKTARACINR